MKLNLPFLLLLMVLMSACSGPASEKLPASTAQPTLPATAGTPNTNTPSTPATAVPSRTATSMPTLPALVTPSPACSATFIPAGFTPDGKHLAGRVIVDGRMGTWLQVLDLQSMAVRTVLKSDEIINVAALSPDGDTAAWALPDFRVQLIRLADGNVTATLTGHTGLVNALLFSADGRRLYSASSDGSVIVWDPQARARQDSFQPTFNRDAIPSEVLGLGISPDGKTLVTIPLDGTARGWDTATFKQVGEYPGSIAGGYNGAHAGFSPDGKYMAIGLAGGPGDTTLWQVDSSRKVWSGGMLSTFDFSLDSRLFAHTELDADNRYQIVIRSVDGQTVYQTIPPASDAMLWDLHFTPDGSRLLAIGNGVLRIWNVSDGSLQTTYTIPCP